MEKIEITEELIIRYIENKTTPEECDALADWIENSEKNKVMFDQMLQRYLTLLSMMTDEDLGDDTMRKLLLDETDSSKKQEGTGIKESLKVHDVREDTRKKRILRFVMYSAGIAAAAALTFFATWKIAVQPIEQMMAQEMSIVSEKGHQSTITLSDGTTVRLNAETTLTYPVVFGKTREVYVDGEALFDVAKDAEHPFIVNTYRYKVAVTGTRFNVRADEERRKFSTALLEGSVTVTDPDRNMSVALMPGEVASTEAGMLQKKTDSDVSLHTLWTEGVIPVDGVPFDELIITMEKSYGVNIVIDREELPEVHYGRMKLKVCDGIIHALESLKRRADFTYYFDRADNSYHIQ